MFVENYVRTVSKYTDVGEWVGVIIWFIRCIAGKVVFNRVSVISNRIFQNFNLATYGWNILIASVCCIIYEIYRKDRLIK